MKIFNPKKVTFLQRENRAFSEKVKAIANQANMTRAELDDLEHRAIFIYDQRNAIKKGERLGREAGLKEGREVYQSNYWTFS